MIKINLLHSLDHFGDFDILHMQNHLLKVTRKAEKLEFHSLRIGIYTDFTAALKERKMFFAVKKSLQQMDPYLLYFYF